MKQNLNFIASGETDIGLVKETNQDSYGVRIAETSYGTMALAILCGGMGGYSKGEVASATVVKEFFKWFDTRLPLLCHAVSQDSIFSEWNQLALQCNQKISSYGSSIGITLGTTLTAMLLTEQQYFMIHVGDSRCYEIADSLTVLTKDQTLVSREVEAGVLTEEAAKTDPRRSVLLQCIGASEQVVPDFLSGEVKPNAVYLLCSDGFYHEITPEEIYGYLSPDRMYQTDLMSANMRALIELDKQRQERDNISVVCVKTC